jgi:hypothetical protein
MRALSAERRTASVDGAAPLTVAADAGLAALEHPFESAELAIDALELGRLSHQDLDPKVVTDRHLIEQAAELGLHHREPLGQPRTLCLELGVCRRSRRWRRLSSMLGDRSRHGTEIWSGRPRWELT